MPIINILTSALLSQCPKFMARVMEPITTGLPSGEQQINHVTIFLKLQRGLLDSTNSCVMTAMITGIYLQLGILDVMILDVTSMELRMIRSYFYKVMLLACCRIGGIYLDLWSF